MIEITTYRPELKQAFVDLNTEWIKTYFRIEEHDLEVFQKVESIMDNGGEIFFALVDGKVVGCCALLHHDKTNTLGEWELAKMAVSPQSQGLGAGNALIEALLAEACRRDIREIYLEGNTRLKASIHMYRKHGFVEIPLGDQSYERVDILMKWQRDE